ncbi:MAG: hypothetical protein CMJ18_26810 [Phycisphaeraceae bacterium]|nr:hypothetical protein [Phycisphaeraceae bacterium]
MRHALVYVLHNAKKHPRRSFKHGIDEFSSARVFDGWREEVEGAVSTIRDAVVVAHAWLLTRGWRRHRLLSVWERPAHE